MAKKYLKFLAKSPYKQQLLQFLRDLNDGNLDGYDIKKLQGHDEVYRARIGKIRCIFQKRGEIYEILDIRYKGQGYGDV